MNYIIVLIPDDNYIYYFGQESLRRNGVDLIMVNKRVQNALRNSRDLDVSASLRLCSDAGPLRSVVSRLSAAVGGSSSLH